MNNTLHHIVKDTPAADTLWCGEHKIPWNDPAFSERILKEHLSQDHHLASRKSEIIKAQVAWITSRYPAGSVLDLGCGPGLYAKGLSGGATRYQGIDFSPASIDYASGKHAGAAHVTFSLGDLIRVEFGGPHDLAMMLYGELNVFSPADCRGILRKAQRATIPGGAVLIEFQNPDAVKKVGQAANTWTRADNGGLFSDEPHVCLTENQWFEEERVALQCFHVMYADGNAASYRSTTKAWSRQEMVGLLEEAGFTVVRFHEDWPVQDDSLLLVSAEKP